MAVELEKEKSIFFHALSIESAGERAAYVMDACEGNELLLNGVSALLKENDRLDSPLDKPLADLFLSSATRKGIPGKRCDQYAPGAMIGPYKLMEQIGEGGFGLVFVADQQQPVRRRVALKIIKPEIGFSQIIARFEAERQALAMMDHENIARVFDAGVTETGQPYFVMELVRGVRLDEFCDNHKLNVKERLELFVSVCHAVQHAHQKGIIHRDLKPSNILVTLQDGRAIPKVIDFGLVKAVSGNLVEQTIYTRFAAMMGTPAYMSPEQAEMSNVDVDTRSDIYTLGVILYELLAGATPIAGDRLKEASLDELRRMIREEDPPRPSFRLTTLGAQQTSTVSQNRRLEPMQLKSLIKGDLDCIVMKALDKDRNRRYPSVEALSMDIGRFLNGETVEARPASHWYRFSKFARRNKVALFVISVVAVSLVLVTTISLWHAQVAFQAMQKARESEQRATQSRKEAESYAQRLQMANALLVTGESYVQSGDWSRAYLSFTKATMILPEYFSVWVQRGSLLARLGLWDAALADYSKAIELGSPVNGIEFQGVSGLFHYFGKTASCREMADRLAESDDGFPGTKLRGQLFGDLSIEQAERLALQCDYLIRDQPLLPSGEAARSMLMPLGVKYYLSGWAHLQAKNFERAIEQLNQSHTDVPDWKGEGIAFPLLAIAHYRSGRIDNARQALEMSEELLDKWLNESVNNLNGVAPMAWFAWMEFVIHYHEAFQLIHGRTPPVDPRFERQKTIATGVLNGSLVPEKNPVRPTDLPDRHE